MSSDLVDRRAFLRAAAAAGAAWAAADLLHIEGALAWAAQARTSSAVATTALTSAEVEVIEALTARILPAVEGRAGAREAGAVYFIDRALATFNKGQKKLYASGIADLNRRARKKRRDATSFAALSAADQDDVIREIEKTPFFQTARVDTIFGTFALPSWGGNRDMAGWHMLGLDHQPLYLAPFGYYDTEGNR